MRKAFVCLLVLGLVFIGCKSEIDDSGIGDTDGRLIITGFSSSKFDGLHVIAFGGDNAEFIAIGSFDSRTTGKTGGIDAAGGKISGGQVTLKVWTETNDDVKPVGYNGNDKNVSFRVFVINYSPIDEDQLTEIRETKSTTILEGKFVDDFFIEFGTATANFTDGFAAASFSSSSNSGNSGNDGTTTLELL